MGMYMYKTSARNRGKIQFGFADPERQDGRRGTPYRGHIHTHTHTHINIIKRRRPNNLLI